MPRSICSLLSLALLLLLLIPENVGAADDLVVHTIECLDSQGKTTQEPVREVELDICQIGDRVTVKVSKLKEWMDAAPENHTLGKLVLALDGQLLVGSHPGRLPIRSDSDGTFHELSFKLVRTQQNANNMAAWKTLLAGTSLLGPKEMTIAIALEGSIENYGQKDIALRVASVFWKWVVGIGYLVLIAAFIWLVASRGLLRDMGPKPAEGSKPFSLGATQMAFWFFIVIGGFLYVWLVAGDFAVLTPGVLGLIGISATTGLVATSVAKAKTPAVSVELSKLEEEKIGLDKRLKDLPTQIAGTADQSNLQSLNAEQEQKRNRLAFIESTIADLTKTPTSVNFLVDILSTGGEVSLPRFQMMAWTIVLGIVFWHTVLTTLNMPEFDATLLGLMGLSSGTYVGFKFPTTKGK
jgi:hypothetical protein